MVACPSGLRGRIANPLSLSHRGFESHRDLLKKPFLKRGGVFCLGRFIKFGLWGLASHFFIPVEDVLMFEEEVVESTF